jgi:hypothetical protein
MSQSRPGLPPLGGPVSRTTRRPVWRLTPRIAVAAAVIAGSALGVAVPAGADTAPPAQTSAPATLVVNANAPFRTVTHVASGALYGLDTATVPGDSLVEPLHPNTFVQMAPGGQQLPNGEPAPGGDALVVAPEAAAAGAKVVVRMPDWYPNFPYKWVSWSDWLGAVDTQVKAVMASGDSNISAFELWNEPDWTWDTADAGSFNAGWTRTYDEVKLLDPGAVIQGPSYSDNISGMQSFLENAVATDTVPDIISWHELESAGKIAGDLAEVTSIEKSLGITPRPIAIEEYGTTSQVGVPEIANYNSGLVLALAGASTASGAQVVQWPDGQVSTGCDATGPRIVGKIGNAVSLCGNGEYVALPSGIVSGLGGDFTISAWVNPSANTTWSRLFDFGTGTTDYMFLTVSDGTELRFAITTGGAGGEQQIKGTGLLPLNTWSLVTVTVSGTTGTLYVNGVAVGSNANITDHPSALGTTTQDWIGRSEYNDPFFNGAVDDFNIYSRALGAAEVATLATGVPGNGDVADYKFDEADGPTATDSSGNGQNATIISSPASVNFGNTAVNDHWWTLVPKK